jgi:DNA-binding MarR family transcriptional regulator
MDKGYLRVDLHGDIKHELKLTESGLNIKEAIFTTFRDVYSEMTVGISKEDLNTVESVMSKMKANMG